MTFKYLIAGAAVVAVGTIVSKTAAPAAFVDDRATVAALDTAYQAAVKANDAATMDRILHKDFVLVLGDGRTASRDDLIGEARNKTFAWDKQDEEPGSQIVRLYGDAAIVTAKLWVKGTKSGAPFDRTLWFSDTYVRTKDGWKYAFGQASLALPPK